MISVVIPAHNEEGFIGECLEHILASNWPVGSAASSEAAVQVVVAANGCSDETVAEAETMRPAVERKGWQLDILDLEKGSKVGALNAADAIRTHEKVVYLDADVHVSAGLLAALAEVLKQSGPVYASGCPKIRKAESFFSERYARFWETLPFMASGVPGCGLYAVNAAGRARWTEFPDVTADDIFVRYQFEPSEMHRVPHSYSWPIAEGFANLVRVRRRQDRGLEEIRQKLPDLATRSGRTAPTSRQVRNLVRRDPVGFLAYAAIALAVRTPAWQNRGHWDRFR
ncbi:glycosyltransferase [Lutimaribacter marinistellae]|uniref:Glycosyltransferase n=1 Tax=Lutimaribacter marinistellae TaxID=1820329 RepID=A0ABV7TDY4_9RHOB